MPTWYKTTQTHHSPITTQQKRFPSEAGISRFLSNYLKKELYLLIGIDSTASTSPLFIEDPFLFPLSGNGYRND
jgi:hypothetical protein